MVPDAGSQIWQWQIINSTKWSVNENLTIKNNFSYGEFRGDTNLDLFGLYGVVPSTVPFGTETSPLQVRPFNTTHYLPNHHTNAELTLVEELQIQGTAADGKLNYQGGLYLEISRPLGLSGIQSTTFTPCSDINTLSCLPFAGGGAVSLGRLSYSTHKNSFIGKAAYFQAGYDFTDRLKATAGIRYTTDKMISDFQVIDLRLGNTIVASAANPRIFNGTTLTANIVRDFAVCTNTPTFGAQGSATNPYMPLANRFTMCDQHLTSKSSKPTWLLGLDYKPIDDTLLYAKWSRGYRQAGVASFAADKLQVYRPETVDTYEIGAKASWRGAVPGFFNIAGFYNDFKDQQIQLGVQCIPTSLCGQTTAILNVGKSTLKGFEAELGIRPIEGLRLGVSWAHLKTKIKEVNGFTDLAGATASINALVTGLGLPYNDIRPVLPGSVLPNSIPDKIVANGSYTLPLPASVGKLSFGATWIWQSAYKVVADNNALAFNTLYFNSTTPTATPQAIPLVGNGILPKTNYGNIHINWEDVGGMPVDASFFITNVTNRHIRLHANTQETQGILSSNVAEPRMMGGRVRLKF